MYKNSSAARAATLWALVAAGCVLSIPAAHAQAAAETAGATSAAATATASIKPPAYATTPAASAQTSPGHLPQLVGPPPEVVNRRNLEQHAGKDAAKLLIRSNPSGSQVWVNSSFVGSTPMMLVLAPGKYHVEFRGPRQETAASAIDLLPRETRELAPTLTAHFPTRVIIR